MLQEIIITHGQKVKAFLENKELRQQLVVALIPATVIAGYFTWFIYPDMVETEPKVLSVNETKTIPSESEVPNSEQIEKDEEETKSKTIKIDISGAVVNPGLKELSQDARIADALALAGGLSNYADKQYIAQALNLAQKLNDGDKIYLPTYYEVSLGLPAPVNIVNKVGDPLTVITSSSTPAKNTETKNSSNQTTSNSISQNQLVNINTASLEELDSLPGIGEVYAKNIIEHRPYSNKNDICNTDIVKNSTTCSNIQDLITL